MRKLLLVALFTLAGCGEKGLTNDQIIAETKKCHAADMRADLMSQRYAGSDVVLRVQCEPKD